MADPQAFAPISDQGTRRAALRAARPYRVAAIAIAVLSLALLPFGIGLVTLVPLNIVALIVDLIGRSRARDLVGIDPGGGRGAELAKNGVVVAVILVAAVVIAILVLWLIVVPTLDSIVHAL
jgi:hypothetical protein